MAKFVLAAGKMIDRDDKNVIVIYKEGDEVELNDEQIQRHAAGKPGSAFITIAERNKRNRLAEEAAKGGNPFAGEDK